MSTFLQSFIYLNYASIFLSLVYLLLCLTCYKKNSHITLHITGAGAPLLITTSVHLGVCNLCMAVAITFEVVVANRGYMGRNAFG